VRRDAYALADADLADDEEAAAVIIGTTWCQGCLARALARYYTVERFPADPDEDRAREVLQQDLTGAQAKRAPGLFIAFCPGQGWLTESLQRYHEPDTVSVPWEPM
jgi:hypothetical protein